MLCAIHVIIDWVDFYSSGNLNFCVALFFEGIHVVWFGFSRSYHLEYWLIVTVLYSVGVCI